jgi:hypothetical protein
MARFRLLLDTYIPRISLKLVAAFLIATTSLAMAAEPTEGDYRQLREDYGLARDGDVLGGLTPAERAALHEALRPVGRDRADRDDAVRRVLYEAYARECDAWAERHPGEACQPAADPAARPGKAIADRDCNQCHRFGSGMAPSFFQLAKRRVWSADALGLALRHSHDMVPVALPDDARETLAAYIGSLR